MNLVNTPLLGLMAPEGLIGLRILGALGLLVMIPLGIYLWRNQDRWFGHSTDSSNETSGSLGYGKAQTWLVYIGALHLVLWLAFGL